MIGCLWRPFIIGRNVPLLEHLDLDGVCTYTHVYPTVSAWICPCWMLVCPQALVIAGISLQSANLYGYIHCKLGGQKAISRVASRLFGTADVPKNESWVSTELQPMGQHSPASPSRCCWPFPGLSSCSDPGSPGSLPGRGTWKGHSPAHFAPHLSCFRAPEERP